MDSEYFWQESGNDNGIIPSNISIDGYASKQQELLMQDSVSPKSTTVNAATSSPQTLVYSRNDSSSLPSRIEKVSSISSDSTLPPDFINPDAIEPKERTYTCRVCQMVFPNKSAVTVHSRTHTNHDGKPFRCHFCEKSFSTNFYLKQHERIHNGNKPYKCPMCDNTFKQLSHVQQHVRTHTGVRPYKCHWQGCGKAFLQQSHLKSHEARHVPKESSGIRPYKCHWPDCEKTFAQLSNLRSHVARHMPGKGKKKKSSNLATKPESEDLNSDSMNMFDVINQAAAAADIVPGTTPDEEAQIQPFLCPGCSKLYVREATFKKHLEECKTKLQQSISATASALGINPPPPPTTDLGLSVNTAGLQFITTSNSKPLLDVKLEVISEVDKMPTKTQVKSNPLEAQPSPLAHVRNAFVQVKDEGTKNHTLQPTVDDEYKFPQIVSTVSLYSPNSSEHQVSLHDNLVLQTEHRKHPTSVSHINRSSPQIHQQNIILTTAGSATGVPVVVSNANSPSPQDLDTSNDVANGPTSTHSTINESAIRWQWDQAVPKLNFP